MDQMYWIYTWKFPNYYNYIFCMWNIGMDLAISTPNITSVSQLSIVLSFTTVIWLVLLNFYLVLQWDDDSWLWFFWLPMLSTALTVCNHCNEIVGIGILSIIVMQAMVTIKLAYSWRQWKSAKTKRNYNSFYGAAYQFLI